MKFFHHVLPLWCTQYRREHLSADLIAGVLVTILVLPQSMAYALLAGLPPQLGLYASILPVIAYAWVGSSMTQAVGPVAVTAIMTFSVLSPLAIPGTSDYIALAGTLSLMSGLLVLAFGALRFGFLAHLLSRPVVAGFISGSAVLILVSQAKLVIGVVANGENSWTLLQATLLQVPHASLPTTALGLAAMAVLIFSRKWLAGLLTRAGVSARKAAFVVRLVPLLTVICGTLAVVFWDLDLVYGVAVVGTVKSGIPPLTLDLPDNATLGSLLFPALTISFIGMVQNITMAQALAIKRRERVDANRELVGLGLSNVVSAFSGGMPVGGGTSRSAVNTASGAQSPLASLVAAIFMAGILIAGTGWFARLPLPILAANIMVAAFSMIDVAALRRAWNYDRADAAALLGTALGVLVLGLQWGIALGIGLSLAALLLRASTPHIAVVGRITGTEHFRNVERHGVETLPHALFLRVDESLFFGNLSAVETRISHELETRPDTRDLILLMTAVNRVDVTALEALTEMDQDLKSRRIRLHLAEIKGPVQDRLNGTPLMRNLSGQVFRSANEAFELMKKGD